MADSSDLTLTTFVPGTKAKAAEVNANFSTLKTAISTKASMNGDSTETFAVADGIQESHAINLGQLNGLSDNLAAKVNKNGTRFCVRSGNVSNGRGDLFSYSVLRITSKIAGVYDDLVISDYLGKQTTISETPNEMSLNGNSDGEYNIFINSEGELYILNNTIYKQAKRPTMVVNDVWLNTSAEPFECIKYSGTSDVEFLDVPLGKVTIKNGAITVLETFQFNQNGYDVTTQTKLESGTNLAASVPGFVMPDYTKGVSKSFSTVYQAASDGFLFFRARISGTFYISSGNADADSTNYSWTLFTVGSFGDQGFFSSTFFPMPKGMYYKAVAADTTNSIVTFYPCIC